MADPNPFDAFDAAPAQAAANPFDAFDEPASQTPYSDYLFGRGAPEPTGILPIDTVREYPYQFESGARGAYEMLAHGARALGEGKPSGAVGVIAGGANLAFSPASAVFGPVSRPVDEYIGKPIEEATDLSVLEDAFGLVPKGQKPTATGIPRELTTTMVMAAPMLFGGGGRAPRIAEAGRTEPPPMSEPPRSPPRAPSPARQIGLHTPGELPPPPPEVIVPEPVAPRAARAPLPDVTELKPRTAEPNPFDVFDLSHAEELPPATRGTSAKPVVIETPEDLTAATAHVRQPTPAQAEAGNYPKAHVNYQGFDVAVETPRGGVRSGVGPDGEPWSVEMPVSYGYIKKTKGTDGEQLDAYLGPNPQARQVYLIDQVHAGTSQFDEAKAMLGFDSEEQARAAYEGAFSDGRGAERIGTMTPMSVEEFQQFVDRSSSRAVRAPAAEIARREPQRLAQFLRKLGGLRDSGGELKHMGAHRVRGLVSDRGLTLDEAAQRAGDQGFLPERFDENGDLVRGDLNDLLEHLYDDLGGRPVYSAQDAARVTAYQRGRARPKAQYVDEAPPFAQVRRTPESPDQTNLPGTEPISDKTLAERRMGGRKGTEKPQKDTGELPLFDTNAGKQKTLFKTENAMPGDVVGIDAVPLTMKQHVKYQAIKREMEAISQRLNPSADLRPVGSIEFIDREGNIGGEADGAAQGSTIFVALEGNRTPLVTVRHEHVHVMRNMDLFRDAEWKALEDAAHRGDWRAKHDIEKYYPEASESVKTEEAIAQEFAEARQSGAPRPKFENIKNPLVRKLFQRMHSFLTQLGGAVRRIFGRKPTAEEVFDLMERGRVGARAENATHERREPMAQMRRDDKGLVGENRPFYSALERGVRELKTDRAPGSQWLATIKNKQGLKPEELEATGLGQFLEENRDRPVTKAEVLEHLRDNGVQLEEHIAGGDEDAAMRSDLEKRMDEAQGRAIQAREEFNAAARRIRPQADEFMSVRNASEWVTQYAPELQPQIEKWGNAEDAARMWGERFDMATNNIQRRGTKFEEYTLPGGKNYREMKLTLPPKGARSDADIERQAQAIAKQRSQDWTAASETVRNAYRDEARDAQADRTGTFQSSHFPEPNIIAHARLKDRVGPNGEKILHVEELQSDWHQKGRRSGYKSDKGDPAEEARLQKEIEDAASDVDKAHQEKWRAGRDTEGWRVAEARERESVDRMQRLQGERDQKFRTPKVPDAPFKKTWPELLLKRLVRYASENGYDKIAWTPGEMQAERYDLSKRVGRVTYSPEGRGLHAYDLQGHQVLSKENVKPEELPDFIGKDAADKLLNHPTRKVKGNMGSSVHELSGLDLKVGGEGMNGFYGRSADNPRGIVPEFLNKYGKKFGARVGETKVDNEGAKAGAFRLEPEPPSDQLWKVRDARDGGWFEFETREAAEKFIRENTEDKITLPSINITPEMKAEVMRGQPLFQMRREPKPEVPDNPRDATPEQVRSLGQLVIAKPVEFMDTVVRDIQMWAAPMALGTPEARASAKDFANVMRLARWHAGQIIRDMTDRFTPAQLRAMWEAADEESVARQRGQNDMEGIGLSRLQPDERQAVEGMQRDAQQSWDAARQVGLVEGEGLPSYVPRILAEMTDAGVTRLRTEGVPGDLHGMGANLRTSSPHMRERKYETVEETEAAARSKFDGNAHVIRDIRTLPLATLSLREAVAGRAFVNKIREMGDLVADPTVSEGHEPQDGRRWFTIDHPSLKTWRPRIEKNDETGRHEVVKDEAGNPVFDRVPIYVRADFEGPLRAILSMKSGALYNASMNLKGRAMTAIMYSPLIHNGVEWGRALPAMPGKVLTFRIYFEGNAARRGLPYRGVASHVAREFSGSNRMQRRDYTQMEQAMMDGMVPIGHGGQFQDITSTVTMPNMAPGRSIMSKLLAAVPGLFDHAAGTSLSPAVKRGVDRLGDVWHNTLLWDRVADLQMGLYVNMKRILIAKGKDPLTAGRVAAHLANRYAGALPIEAMGHMSRKIANTVMFSRSFTVGNWGAMKDAVGGYPAALWNAGARMIGSDVRAPDDIGGLPRDVQAQILRDSGFEALKSIRSYARRKALGIIAVDIALLYAVNSILQSTIAMISGQSDLDEEERAYVDRFKGLLANVQEDPSNLIRPFGMIESLTPNAWNEPDKGDRVFSGFDQDGTAIYLRPPTGKVGEEFIGWTNPWKMMSKKLSPEIKPFVDIYNNDLGFGRKVYDPYDESISGWMKAIGASVMHIMAAQLPTPSIEALGRITGVSRAIGYDTAPATRMDTLKTVGPLIGTTFSQGAPGGPAVGEMYQHQEEQRFRIQQAMPGIRAKIRDGDTAGAVKTMTELNVPPGLIKYYIRTTLHPETRLSGRALRDFMRQAGDEEKARMARFRQQQSAQQTPGPNPFDAFGP
jgi:hypothetical protein